MSREFSFSFDASIKIWISRTSGFGTDERAARLRSLRTACLPTNIKPAPASQRQPDTYCGTHREADRQVFVHKHNALQLSPEKQGTARVCIPKQDGHHKGLVSSAAPTPDCAKIAQAVALILQPTIITAVEHSLKQGLAEIKKELYTQAQQLAEEEQRISVLEDDLSQAQNKCDLLDRTTQVLKDKVDDLENRSRRNNFRIVGLPV